MIRLYFMGNPPTFWANRGLWAKPPATKKARPIGSACPDGYPVKGNQGSRSTTDWIYHVPGDNSYSVTVPEECFVTAADAEAAGYRPARR